MTPADSPTFPFAMLSIRIWVLYRLVCFCPISVSSFSVNISFVSKYVPFIDVKPLTIFSGKRPVKVLIVSSLTLKPVLRSTWGLLNSDRYTKKQNNRVIKSANVIIHFASLLVVFFSPNMFSSYTIHF